MKRQKLSWKVDIPASWNDLTRKQYINICHLLGAVNLQMDENEDAEAISNASIILCLKVILKMPMRKFKLIDSIQIADMLHYTDFITKDVTVDKQFIPKIRIFGFPFYGPAAELEHSTFSEFIKADSLFEKIQKGESTDIYKLMATLYRPKKMFHFIRRYFATYDGDKRIAYNDKSVDRRAKLFSRFISKRKAYAVLYFYWGFRNTNVLIFKNVFKPAEPSQGKRTGNDYGWAGTLLEISNGKFGHFDSTSRTTWSTILISISKEIDDRRAQDLNL